MHRPQLSTPAASVSLILLPDEFLKTVFLNECKIFQHTHVIPCPVSLIQCFQPFARIYGTSFAVYVKYKPYHYSKVKNMTRRCTNSGAAYHWRICQSNGRDRIQATWGVKPFRNGPSTDKLAFLQTSKKKRALKLCVSTLFLWSGSVIRKCEQHPKTHWKSYIFTA